MNNNEEYSQKSDKELISLTLKDNTVYRYLVERYEAKLLRYITRISYFRHEDAEDILQDVFIKVYKNLNEYNNNLSFSSWIYRITHNEVVSHIRKLKARPNVVSLENDNLLMTNALKSELDLEDKIDKKHLISKIGDSLNSLDEKYKQVLVLKYLEYKDYREISDIIKKPIGTVSTLVSRAKKQLKNEIINSNHF